MRTGTLDAITASPTYSLAGNSADYREIDQGPGKDVTMCVRGMLTEECFEDACRSLAVVMIQIFLTVWQLEAKAEIKLIFDFYLS